MAYGRMYIFTKICHELKKLKKVVDNMLYICYSNKGFKMVRWSSG